MHTRNKDYEQLFADRLSLRYLQIGLAANLFSYYVHVCAGNCERRWNTWQEVQPEGLIQASGIISRLRIASQAT